MLTTARYILITALRDWLFVGLSGAILAAMAIAHFLGGTAVAEQWQMTAAYMAGSVRAIITGGMIVFVCFHVRRMFENREVEVILTRPISRTSFVIAYWLGFAVVSFCFALPIAAAMRIVLPIRTADIAYWAFSLQLEMLLLIAFALFVSLILRTAVVSVIISFAFYAISRMMGFFLYLFETPPSPSAFFAYTENALQLISYIMPRLDLYAKSAWLIYGTESDMHMLLCVAQSAIYIPLVLAMAICDFRRKQF